MATISFLYRSKRDKAKLKIRFFFRREHKNFFLEVSTRLEVTKDYWERYHETKRINDIRMKNLQTAIKNEINLIENCILNAAEQVPETSYNKAWLEQVILGYYEPHIEEEGTTEQFLDWINKYISEQKKTLTIGTIKKSTVIMRLVERFEKSKNKTYSISEIDLRFKNEFEEYCNAMGYAQNTIARCLVFAKTVCNYAKVNGIEVSKTLDLVKTKRIRVESIYLTDAEIEAIENLDDLPDYLDNVRDWLLISCFTGQRVSDFMRFDETMIRYEKNKKDNLMALIEFRQKKTGKLMSIPLSSKVMRILNKRAGNFPRVLSDQKYNDFIKVVCEKAEIKDLVAGSRKVEQDDGVYRKAPGLFEKWQLVSSHVGRRSFATNNYGKIPTVFLMNMTGHSTEAMFLTYIGKGSKDIAMELSEYFD